MTKESEHRRVVATNKRARFAYELQDELECGIVLKGTEVKSLREGHCSIAEAYARVRGGELFLVGATIPEYRCGNVFNHEPTRERKLLAHRREIGKWTKRVKERGMTIVPMEVAFVGSRVKVLLGLGKGKRLVDKRQAARARSDRRDIDRAAGRRR
ncbi:MAG: SsrA-binding protein SmpB [Planctomycetota bacterium]|jgi:SsrA-binding protein|nr:SsrA-binding protein SmpB [Planctomycetota bacterium]MDP6762348.1 SsrA-binding protein SmpB [Planctomycetota bacterium]MDP6990035.1 SsrA-binding protein SmpB [Planctomycetota bacterium]